MGMLSNIFSKIVSTASASSIVEQIKSKNTQATEAVASPEPAETPETPAVQENNILNAFDTFDSIDVVSTLDELVQKSTQKLNWKTSIVDLLKLLGLDSSLDARKKLAAELNYTGSTEDSAAMNIWLHKAVMQKIAENGGNVNGLF